MIRNSKVVVFDLDDTLIDEADFLYSAFAEIAQNLSPNDATKLKQKMIVSWRSGKNVFDELMAGFSNVNLIDLLHMYRNHQPQMEARRGVVELLKYLKGEGVYLGLVTDGRSITQRNKLKSTGLINYFDKLVISEEFGSEKPNVSNFTVFCNNNKAKYFYIGDNTSKDFIGPNSLAWKTICLNDNGKNIHPQNFELPTIFLPQFRVNNFIELKTLLQSLFK